MENTTRTNKPTIIATDSLSSVLAASGNRWTRNPKTKNIRRLRYIRVLLLPLLNFFFVLEAIPKSSLTITKSSQTNKKLLHSTKKKAQIASYKIAQLLAKKKNPHTKAENIILP
jgi:cell division protein FtsB